jgi:hypothetical protein
MAQDLVKTRDLSMGNCLSPACRKALRRDCRATGMNAAQENHCDPCVIQQFFADWWLEGNHSAIGAWGSIRLVPYK